MTAVATALTPASAPAADDDTRRTHGAKQQHGRNDGPVVSRRLRWTAKAAALTLLREYGVHNVQGYLMGRPRPLSLARAA